ncbi:MAG: hypothetical protein AB7K24_04885 [Gemmataceae bacterium]
MTAERCFPDPRTLVGWCRQSCAHSCQLAWLAHLRIVYLEVLVETDAFVPLGRFEQLMLAAFAGEPCNLEELDARLHLGRHLLSQILKRLATADLIAPVENGGFALTPLGEAAQRQGQYAKCSRRSFSLVERPGQAAHFLSLSDMSHEPGENAMFEPALLDACLRQSIEWKQRHGFPLDVKSVIAGQAARCVPVVHAAWLPVFLTAPEDRSRLEGRVFKENGQLTRSPAFKLDGAWPEVLPQLNRQTSDEDARRGWEEWCRAFDLSLPAEVVQVVEGSLRVTLAAEPARQARAKLADGPWALIGDDNTRFVAVLDIVSP